MHAAASGGCFDKAGAEAYSLAESIGIAAHAGLPIGLPIRIWHQTPALSTERVHALVRWCATPKLPQRMLSWRQHCTQDPQDPYRSEYDEEVVLLVTDQSDVLGAEELAGLQRVS